MSKKRRKGRAIDHVWRFVKLTRVSDGTPVLINVPQIKAIYKYYGRDTTVVVYSEAEDGFVAVLESVEAIENILHLMEYGK
jgi:hypothetical protein